MKRFFILFFSWMLVHLAVQGQDLALRAEAPNAVKIGQQFRYTLTIGAEGENLRLPDFKDFKFLMGPTTSRMMSIQNVNGKTTRAKTYTFTCILMAEKEGVYSIPSATIEVKGEKITSNPVTIKVLKGQVPQSTTPKSSGEAGTFSRNDLFVRVLTNKKSLYQNEHLIATIKIYTRVNVVGLDDANYPEFQGFLSQEIQIPGQATWSMENVNGVTYKVATLKKTILFPQRSGEIVIDPVKLECRIRMRTAGRGRSIFDDFFDSYQDVNKRVESKSVKIKVKPFPVNKPSGFTGAVGNFVLNSSVDKTKLKANEALTYRISVKGTGNLKVLELPKISFPADFEVYDPKIVNNLKNTEGGVKGEKTVEYLVIPRYSGSFEIPPASFSFFDPKTQRYKTLKSEAYTLEVEKGSGEELHGVTVPGVASKEQVKFLGKDIRFIKKRPVKLRPQGFFLHGSLNYSLAYVVPSLLFMMIFFIYRKQVKIQSNQALVRHRKANKVAKRRLKKAAIHLKVQEKERFYEELMRALWGYVSDKLNMPIVELSKENVEEVLSTHQVDQAVVSQFLEILNTCEFARYAPAGGSGEMDRMYQEAADIIGTLEGQIK